MSTLKKFAVLGAIGYDVTIQDGQVVFDEAGGFYGTHTQFAFERPVDIGNSPGIWYFVWMDSSSERVPACHIHMAIDWLEENVAASFKPWIGEFHP